MAENYRLIKVLYNKLNYVEVSNDVEALRKEGVRNSRKASKRKVTSKFGGAFFDYRARKIVKLEIKKKGRVKKDISLVSLSLY